jgi:hypothetical protein
MCLNDVHPTTKDGKYSRNRVHKTNKEKYGSFGNYILNNPTVYRNLFVTSIIFPPIMFALLLFLLYMNKSWEIFFITLIFFFAFLSRVLKFFKNGGLNSIPPDATANKYLWGKE